MPFGSVRISGYSLLDMLKIVRFSTGIAHRGFDDGSPRKGKDLYGKDGRREAPPILTYLALPLILPKVREVLKRSTQTYCLVDNTKF